MLFDSDQEERQTGRLLAAGFEKAEAKSVVEYSIDASSPSELTAEELAICVDLIKGGGAVAVTLEKLRQARMLAVARAALRLHVVDGEVAVDQDVRARIRVRIRRSDVVDRGEADRVARGVLGDRADDGEVIDAVARMGRVVAAVIRVVALASVVGDVVDECDVMDDGRGREAAVSLKRAMRIPVPVARPTFNGPVVTIDIHTRTRARSPAAAHDAGAARRGSAVDEASVTAEVAAAAEKNREVDPSGPVDAATRRGAIADDAPSVKRAVVSSGRRDDDVAAIDGMIRRCPHRRRRQPAVGVAAGRRQVVRCAARRTWTWT